MGIFKKLFGTNVKENREGEGHEEEVHEEAGHEEDEVWNLVCENCGEIFRLGQDANLVTDEDLFNTVLSAGGNVIVHGNARREPDLVVKRSGLSREEKSGILKKVARVRGDLAEGSERQWHCGSCRTTHSY